MCFNAIADASFYSYKRFNHGIFYRENHVPCAKGGLLLGELCPIIDIVGTQVPTTNALRRFLPRLRGVFDFLRRD